VEPAERLAERLRLPIRDPRLLARALTHSSWLHEHPGIVEGHNERLEFLGDAVVNLAISEALFARYPDDDEGLLSARRAAIVSSIGLAALAERIELGDALLLGEGESQRGARSRPSLLASAFEAVAGAILLDLGWEAARSWVIDVAAPEIAAEVAAATLKSPKSRLQEYAQQRRGARPGYRVVEAAGPDHEKVFRVEVDVDGELLGTGVGSSRRQAETAAAAEAITILAARAAADADSPEPGERAAVTADIGRLA
jgi:ribonuclease III